MPKSISENLKPITDLWQSWSPGRRWTVIGLFAGAMAILLLWAGVFNPGSRMSPLFSRLEPSDAAAITQLLEERGVPYQLDDEGRTVMVPSSDVHRLRLSFAGEGLPGGGVVGFEIMDEAAWATTDFGRKVSYIRAIQGELTRTIRQIEGVENARVHIVVPESTLFVRDQRPASAAVLLTLKAHHSPNASQTRAIMHLVSASVDDLEPESVTVVDDSGRILSAEVALDPMSDGLRTQMSQEREFEDVLEGRVQTLLDQVLGPGNSVVRVKAYLNFDERVVERQLFEPAEDGRGILRSIQELEETFSGMGPAPGSPGVDTNVPSYVIGESGETEYSRTERIENYELAESRERLVVAPGAVERLSVAVVVNDNLTEEQLGAISDAVSATIGFDPERRDQISVVGQPFDTTMWDRWQDQVAEETLAREVWQRQVLYGLAALLLVLIVVGLLTRRARRARKRAQEELKAMEETAKRQSADGETARQLFPDTVPEEDQLRKSIRELAKQDPQRVADAIKLWLHED